MGQVWTLSPPPAEGLGRVTWMRPPRGTTFGGGTPPAWGCPQEGPGDEHPPTPTVTSPLGPHWLDAARSQGEGGPLRSAPAVEGGGGVT